jgi:hypothetical protein
VVKVVYYGAMFGILLALIASFFEESATSLGKWEMRQRKETPMDVGFLNVSFAWSIYVLLVLFRWPYLHFSIQSWPTLGLEMILGVTQAVATLYAVKRAERTTLGFLRIVTIPLLLAVDMLLGYDIGFLQVLGILLIVIALIVLFINHGIKKSGAWLSLFTAVDAAAGISLFKYNVVHFNSPEIEQLFVVSTMLFFFTGWIVFRERRFPLKQFLNKEGYGQGLMMSFASVVESYAYLYAPASVLIAAKRAAAVMWALVSGSVVFHEKHLVLKTFSASLIVGGICLLLFS